MKSFIRTKNINGIDYKYQITPYYDKISKKVKQRSKYLGKEVNGKTIKVRQKTPKEILNYGEILPLLKILEDYKIKDFLNKVFGEKMTKQIITLVLCKTLTHLSLRDVERWYESNYISLDYGEISLSSQSLSNLLSKIGQKPIGEQLTSHLIKLLSSKRTLYYDITSISSYSELITMLEWGYNRDSLSLPQVNLSVIVDKDEGIPIAYQMYPGSISDVKTISNTIKRLTRQEIELFTLILDRGFFSNSNIQEIRKTKAEFIIAVPERYSSVTKLLSETSEKIEKSKYARLYEGELIFAKNVIINTGEVKLKGYVYYNPTRAQKERESFYKRILMTKQAIESIKHGKSVKSVIEDKTGKLASYFQIEITDSKIKATIKDDLVAKRLQNKGLFLIAYCGKYEWNECLSLYKSKQIIEKCFDILKNDLDITTPYVHRNDSLQGLLFISLISLLIRMRILKLLKDKEKNNEYSFERVVLELQKLKAIIYPDKEIIFNEITKKQSELLNLFDAVPKL